MGLEKKRKYEAGRQNISNHYPFVKKSWREKENKVCYRKEVTK